MKRILCVLLVIGLLGICGCKSQKDIADVSSYTGNTSDIASSEIYEEPPVEEEPTPQPEESQVESEPVSSKPAVQKPASPPSTPPSYVAVGGFQVFDPDNTRGLDTTKNGYGFGIGKDGQPPALSLSNQARFDSFGTNGLALDTRSGDKRLYLTFDCGYEYNGLTGVMLDILAQKGVKAAFFCTLSYINSNPQLVSRMINEGHIVGNHSVSHACFPNISRTKMADEVYGVHEAMLTRYGYEMKYFRFPEGAYSQSALDLVNSVGYRSVFWSVAYDDWDTSKQKGSDYAFNTVTSRLHSGAVILLHAVSVDNANTLGSIIDYAVQNGYTFKTLDEYAW